MTPRVAQCLDSGSQPDDNNQGNRINDASAAVAPESRNLLVTEAEPAPLASQYPDTPLYQFADIELAHHHHH